MKTVLIISPHFPPANAADMQRVRMSLPYFSKYGWNVEIVKVKGSAEIVEDLLLLENIPENIVIHTVDAFNKKWTSKFGLGSIALRSLWFYKRKVNKLLSKQRYDLIYFSTTQFPICILGAYWKKKFGIPYIIDMQDPWHSTYYEDKPKVERPPKYWFSYRLNKLLEPIAMKNVDGLVSVSQGYLDTLVDRYPILKHIPKKVITFGAYEADSALVKEDQHRFKVAFKKKSNFKHFVYVGRGGADMNEAVTILLKAFKIGLKKQPDLFEKVRFHFIGTSYAPKGKGKQTIKPVADAFGLAKYVEEKIDRVRFYDGLFTLEQADALVILGSNDTQYTASKIYPYIMAKKPLLAIFHPNSNANKILSLCTNVKVHSLLNENDIDEQHLFKNMLDILQDKIRIEINAKEFDNFSATTMTHNQVELFNQVVTK